MTKKETVGKVASELMVKEPETLSPLEQMEENLTDYEKNIMMALSEGIKTFNHDFFIEVVSKKERLMPNVLRNYFVPRLSCPTPFFEQVVYKYDYKDQALDFLWVIPDKETCDLLYLNKFNVDPTEWDLLEFVIRYKDGSLLQLSMELNGELECKN